MMQSETGNVLVESDREPARFPATINRLLDQVSHDFRTPLTVIKEFATLMRDGLVGPVSPRQRELLDVINDRADDLTLIVDNVLDAGKFGAGVLRAWRRPTGPGEVVTGVQDSLARKAAIKGVEFDVAIEPNLQNVYADREQLARSLTNLLSGVLKSFAQPRAIQLWEQHMAEGGD